MLLSQSGDSGMGCHLPFSSQPELIDQLTFAPLSKDKCLVDPSEGWYEIGQGLAGSF